MYVACSTLCFGRRPLEDALRVIAELEFNKFDVAIDEKGPHLRPSEVAQDVGTAAARLRFGPGLVPTAFSVAIEAASVEEYDRLFKAVCRLARISAVPLISLEAAPVGSDLDAEVKRLTRLVRLGIGEGIQVTVATHFGALTEDPDVAVILCQRTPGLGLTLDPSHYLAGPHQAKGYDQVFPYVRHVQLRDTGRGPNQFQVRVGQGEVEYGRIVSQLARHRYERVLTVDVRDVPEPAFPMEPEVRKLKFLLESLV